MKFRRKARLRSSESVRMQTNSACLAATNLNTVKKTSEKKSYGQLRLESRPKAIGDEWYNKIM